MRVTRCFLNENALARGFFVAFHLLPLLIVYSYSVSLFVVAVLASSESNCFAVGQNSHGDEAAACQHENNIVNPSSLSGARVFCELGFNSFYWRLFAYLTYQLVLLVPNW